MNDLILMLNLFGNRYINCDNEQAIFDAQYNREELVSTFNAMIHFLQNCSDKDTTEDDMI